MVGLVKAVKEGTLRKVVLGLCGWSGGTGPWLQGRARHSASAFEKVVVG